MKVETGNTDYTQHLITKDPPLNRKALVYLKLRMVLCLTQQQTILHKLLFTPF